MGDNLNGNELDQIFDEDKLDKAIKKGKRKSLIGNPHIKASSFGIITEKY